MRLSYLLLLLPLLVSSVEERPKASSSSKTLIRDVGAVNVTIHCERDDEDKSVNWIFDGRNRNVTFAPNGDLVLLNGLEAEDAKVYVCQDADSNESIHTVYVQVKKAPPAVLNLTVAPESVLADVSWNMAPLQKRPRDGLNGVFTPEIESFLLRYRLEDVEAGSEEAKWTTLEVNATSTAKSVFGLAPNSTYYFRVSAVNAVGEGKVVSVFATTENDLEQIREAEKETRKHEEEIHKTDETRLWKIWLLGIGVMILTFSVIGFGISLLLVKNCDKRRMGMGAPGSGDTTEEEAMELVPHITLNPSFNIDMLEYLGDQDQAVHESPIIKPHARPRPDKLIDIHNDEDDEINA